MRTPRQVWHGRTTVGGGTDLAAVIRRYARMPGARLMTRGQVTQVTEAQLTPLERALSPAPQKPCGPAAATPEEALMGKRSYDESDPDNRPLTDEERRLDEIQTRGLRERQADQKRAGQRFDILSDDWGDAHGNL